MSSLRRNDFESALRFVGEASELECDEPFPTSLLARLQELVRCDAITYSDEVFASRETYAIAEVGPEDDGSDVDGYWRWGPCPTKAYRHRTGDLSAIRTSDVVARSHLHELPVYREYFRPNGVEHLLDMGLPADAGHDRSLVLFRDFETRDFSARDRDVLELLRPHLRRIEAHAALRRRLNEGVEEDERYAALTRREREVVALLARGKTNAEIAAILWVAPSTVKKHLEHVYAKTGIRRRAAAAALVPERVARQRS